MTATRAVNAPLPYQSSIPNPVMNLQEPGHPGGGRGGAVGKAVSAEEICPDEENGPRNQRNRSQNGVLLRFPCRGWEPLDQAKHQGKNRIRILFLGSFRDPVQEKDRSSQLEEPGRRVAEGNRQPA